MKQTSERREREASAREKIRRMRASHRRNLIIVGVLFFAIGCVAGVFGQRWYDRTDPDAAQTVMPDITAEPVPAVTPEPEAPAGEGEPEGFFVEPGAEQPDDGAEIFPEAEAPVEETPVEEAPVEEAPVEEAPVEEVPVEEGSLPEGAGSPEGETEGVEAPAEETVVEEAPAEEAPVEEAPAEETPVEEAPTEEGSLPEGAGSPEGETEGVEAPVEEIPAEETVVEEAPAEEAPAEEVPVEEAPVEEASVEQTPMAELPVLEMPAGTPSGETPAEGEIVPIEGEAPVGEAPVEAAPSGPQVIAIVPYGESFTYSTQIRADGNARVEATDEPYETISFTQTMKDFMRPSDFAAKYSTVYKLQGNEAGAGFELVLNDYTGSAAIVPQNVVDISLRSESGNSVERGYQLMDAEMGGNYGVALLTNVPKMLYKRYQYSNAGEEMFYLVVTTYNDGVPQMILFQLESDEPEPEPAVIYNTLQRGIVSDEVANMQARLVELGYLNGVADGQFGPMTEEAIKAAQRAFGLEPNGIADNAFQQKLYEGAPPPTPAPEAEEGEASDEDAVG